MVRVVVYTEWYWLLLRHLGVIVSSLFGRKFFSRESIFDATAAVVSFFPGLLLFVSSPTSGYFDIPFTSRIYRTRQDVLRTTNTAAAVHGIDAPLYVD